MWRGPLGRKCVAQSSLPASLLRADFWFSRKRVQSPGSPRSFASISRRICCSWSEYSDHEQQIRREIDANERGDPGDWTRFRENQKSARKRDAGSEDCATHLRPNGPRHISGFYTQRLSCIG